MHIPVSIFWGMDMVVETVWLADNEWIWEGHKLPCEFNNVPKMIFITALKVFFNLLEGSITGYFMDYLEK